MPSEFEYTNFVSSKIKHPKDILKEFNAEKAHLTHLIIGIVSEAGELIDALKKVYAYDKPVDYTNLIEELGDLEFYMAELRSFIGVTREGVLDANMEKLNKRYKDKFTNKEAEERNDKKE